MATTNSVDWPLIIRLGAQLGANAPALRMWKYMGHIPHWARLPLIASSGGVISSETFAKLDTAAGRKNGKPRRGKGAGIDRKRRKERNKAAG